MKGKFVFSFALAAVMATGSLFVAPTQASAASYVAVLGVTQITAVQTYATAGGGFDNGWRVDF